MLEDNCHVLDHQVAAHMATTNNKICKAEFDKFVDVQKKVLDLETSAANCQEKIDLVFEAISTAILRSPENDKTISEIYEPRLINLNEQMKSKVEVTYLLLT